MCSSDLISSSPQTHFDRHRERRHSPIASYRIEPGMRGFRIAPMLTSCNTEAALVWGGFAQFRSLIVRVLCPTCSEYSQFEAIEVPARGRLIMCQSCDVVWTVKPAEVLEDLPSEAKEPRVESDDFAPPAPSSRKLLAAAISSFVIADRKSTRLNSSH